VDREMALEVVTNAKVQRPSTCNALDTLLVHSETASHLLPDLARRLGEAGVELRCDSRALSLLGPVEGVRVTPATAEDWGTEFLDLILSVRVVDSLEEALAHIEGYGSGHSEAIVTKDYAVAMRFLNEVDAAAVFVNASTRFTDGARFGLGAEVAISTNKFHARGPMGLRELTSYKWVIHGNGHIVE
jgi:glutamate-5-semialdehyde dehydrogenase